jgi:hypothetical protein
MRKNFIWENQKNGFYTSPLWLNERPGSNPLQLICQGNDEDCEGIQHSSSALWWQLANRHKRVFKQ